jgi:TolB-like protein
MKKLILLLFILQSLFGYSQQIKVAIVDFENTSGIAKYDGLGKAMSSMLISDIEANVSPKRLQLVERSQINKILKEQNFQKTSSVNKASAVKMGKLLGVKYLLVGDIFVLNDALVINSRLVDTETGDIKFTEKKEGKLMQWLFLKTALAKGLSTSISMPFTEPVVLDKEINSALVTTFSNAITEKDKGNLDKSEELLKIVEEFASDFKYINDIKEDIEKLKKRVSELENITNIITNNFELGEKTLIKGDCTNSIKYFESFVKNPGTDGYVNNKILYAFSKISYCYFKNGDFLKALENSENAVKIYKYFPEANEVKLMALIKLSRNEEAIKQYDFIVNSLTFESEQAFRSKDENHTINWDATEWPNFGLKPDEQSEFWVYLGINKAGYYDPIVNEVKLIKTLSENNIKLEKLKSINKGNEKIKSKYEKFEQIIINESKDFSSAFYELSLIYAEELFNNKNFNEYEDHLVKEITRMEGKNLNTDSDENYKIIYGKFILNQLLYLIEKNEINAASKLYKKLKTEYVTDRKSYFYEHYWDIILSLRVKTSDFNTTYPINMLVFEKKLNELIIVELQKKNISKEKFNKVLNFNNTVDNDNKNIEIDKLFSIDNFIWSKNIGIMLLNNNLKIHYAKNKIDLYNYKKDSVPAYCYYDYNEEYGEEYGEKYGKLYNYYALKLISANLPIGWRIAKQNDFIRAFELDKLLDKVNEYRKSQYTSLIDYYQLLSGYKKYYKEKIPEKIEIKSGYFHGNGFIGIDTQQLYWTDELSKDPEYKKIIEIYEDEIRLSNYNCPECCLSIKLIKE